MNGTDADDGTGADPGARGRPLGLRLLIWLYWFWAGAVALVFLGFAAGEGPVMMDGEAVPRRAALEVVLPVLLPMGMAAVGAGLALTLERTWARAAALLPLALAAFGPALSGAGATRGDIVTGALVLLPFMAGLVWYLYLSDGVSAYFAALEVDAAGPDP